MQPKFPPKNYQLPINSINIRSSSFFWPAIFKQTEALQILSTFRRLPFFSGPFSNKPNFCQLLLKCFLAAISMMRMPPPLFTLENKPQKFILKKNTTILSWNGNSFVPYQVTFYENYKVRGIQLHVDICFFSQKSYFSRYIYNMMGFNLL